MHLHARYTGAELLTQAAVAPPFGPGFTAAQVDQPGGRGRYDRVAPAPGQPSSVPNSNGWVLAPTGLRLPMTGPGG